eukprot:m.87078 g.87078  ORF g.87078 m.87078 type:complete len:105 (-) comp16391_c0_seq1:668-982(-)
MTVFLLRNAVSRYARLKGHPFKSGGPTNRQMKKLLARSKTLRLCTKKQIRPTISSRVNAASDVSTIKKFEEELKRIVARVNPEDDPLLKVVLDEKQYDLGIAEW